MLPFLMNHLAFCFGGGGGRPEDAWRNMLIPLLIAMVAYFLIIGRFKKKQQRKRQDELRGIKKNARIMTIGGIYGTVVQSRDDDNKVVIKIDEATNTRMTISRSAIRNVVTGKEDEQESSSK